MAASPRPARPPALLKNIGPGILAKVRAGVKANYGDDSQQFEWVGGTRISERKRSTRRVIEA